MTDPLEDPRMKAALAMVGVLCVLSFVDDVVMIASFWMDGSYWAFAGRLGAFLVVGTCATLLARSALRAVRQMKEEQEQEITDDPGRRCNSHRSMRVAKELESMRKLDPEAPSGCIFCWLGTLHDRQQALHRRTRHDE